MFFMLNIFFCYCFCGFSVMLCSSVFSFGFLKLSSTTFGLLIFFGLPS